MYCAQKITTKSGEVNFGFSFGKLGKESDIHVKLVSARLFAAPDRFANIQDIVLRRDPHNEKRFVIPVFKHNYWDDFSSLVHSATKQIDWADVERRLYAANVEQLDSAIARERTLLQQVQERLSQLQNSKDVARDKAERGLLQQAMSYIQSVIFRSI